jgi:methyltransferase (TIGR00027 family)
VLLGAGYDSRAYRYVNSNHRTRVFELDIAPTQDRKRKCLKAARIDIPQQVRFVPINFNEESLRDVLEKAGYEHQEKTLFIWEGVSYYLDVESVDATLEFVSKYSHKDSVIAFDYTISVTEENINRYYGAKEFTQTMKEHHANEELMFSIEEGEIDSFLEQRELKMVEHLDNEGIERKYLINDNGQLIGQITGHFRFVAASRN